MKMSMQNSEVLSEEQLHDFLQGTAGVNFVGQKKEEVYAWVERVLTGQEFLQQDKKQRGAVRAYVEKVRAARSDPADPAVPEHGEREGEGLSATGVSADLHRPGRRAVGGDRPGAR